MLHGAKLTDAKPLKTQKLFETGEYQSFHLSSVILDAPLSDQKARVKLIAVLENKQEITLAILSKDRDAVKVDLYFNVTQDVKLVLKGAPKGTEVSLSGYYEPSADDVDDDMFMGAPGMEDDDEDDDEDDEEEVAPVKAKAVKQVADDSSSDSDEDEQPKKKSALKASKAAEPSKKEKKMSETEKLN